MKKVILVVMVLLCGTSITKGTTYFDDGGIHDVYSEIAAAEIQDNFWDEPTTVNLQSTGKIGTLTAWDNSQFNIYGGTITHLSILDESQANLYYGTIEWSVYVRNDSQMTIYDGTIGGYLYGKENSIIDISGGSISESVTAEDNSQITISGGTVDSLLGIESTNALVSIIGYDFILDGHSVYGEIMNTSNEVKSGHVTGTYFGGASIDLDIQMQPNTSIMFIPEPSTLLLLGIGAVMLRRKR